MKIILSSNPYRDHGLRAALEAQRILKAAGADTVVCIPFAPKKGDRVDMPKHVPVQLLADVLTDADLLICFGGDGTILHAAKAATLHNVPIMGVNMGSVGFMAELERGELKLLSSLTKNNGKLVTEDRMMLDVKVYRGEKLLNSDLALNDVVISKGSMARVAEMEVLADGDQITELHGDGVIISTPTGSTAYSMSAGGPIVEPTSECTIVTPVCAHQLAARAMVLNAKRVVTVRVPRGNRKHLYLSVDGSKAIRLSGGDRVEISRSARRTRLVRLLNRSFYQLINRKLGGCAQ